MESLDVVVSLVLLVVCMVCMHYGSHRVYHYACTLLLLVLVHSGMYHGTSGLY